MQYCISSKLHASFDNLAVIKLVS